jgi:glucose/arabinose dehydrogenase
VKGVVDADPTAAGSGYALDDIPVPVNNPYGVPMTTSGLAFDADGVAYISTLVGDIWKVTGLDRELAAVTWRRYASGISLPLGLEMVDGVLYVLGEGGITRLHDYNKDGEADYYERFTKMGVQLGGLGAANQNLERDAAGNFYACGKNGIVRISPDGKKLEVISAGARNPLGLGLRPDGLALSDSSEGSPSNGTCTI